MSTNTRMTEVANLAQMSELRVRSQTGKRRHHGDHPGYTKVVEQIGIDDIADGDVGMPRSAEITKATSSGSEVPTATIVMPITNGEMPNRSARFTSPQTNRLNASTRKKKPPITCSYIIVVGLYSVRGR